MAALLGSDHSHALADDLLQPGPTRDRGAEGVRGRVRGHQRRAELRDLVLHPAPLPERLPEHRDGIRRGASLDLLRAGRVADLLERAPVASVGLLRGGDALMATRSVASPSAHTRATTVHRIQRGLLYAVALLVAARFMGPLLFSLMTSLKGPSELYALPPILLPAEPQWSNYL